MTRLLLISALLTLVSQPVLARVERFAVVVGNNQGAIDEPALHYAEADAERVYDVLLQLGDIAPVDAVLLRGRDAATVRATLLAINERIRDAMSAPDTQVVLIVYYSGHADAQALHLRGTELPVAELRQLARGSAANFRLVVLDACRSGALTRVKGGQRAPAFALPTLSQEMLPGDGIAFLTASSAHEDAQESDELQGAFFTHALVSGLLGAADADLDGAVVLDEVYRYAYESTLRATSRTLAGTQHPTFHYDLRGRGQLVLTRPRAHAAERATLQFPANLGFLLMRGSADGNVAIELGPSDQARTLSLEPGHYFVRARAPDVMYEGTLDAASGTSRAVTLDDMERIDYARLVRKGGRSGNLAHGLEVAASIRSPLPNSDTVCVGGVLGYALDFGRFGARALFGMCASALANDVLSASLLAYDLQLDAYHAWDVSITTLQVSVGGGMSLFDQHFQTRGAAPSRLSAAPFLALGFGSELHLPYGLYASLNVAAETHFLRIIEMPNQSELKVGFAVRTTLGFGKHF